MTHQIQIDIAKIKEFIQQQKVNVKETFTVADAAIYLGVSTSLLYKLTSQRKISHYKPGSKLIFFKKKDLDDWATSGEVLSIEKLSEIDKDRSKVVKVL